MRTVRTAVLGVLLLFTAGALSAGVSTILTIDEAKSKQPGVAFDHAKHAGELVDACSVCHHTQKGLTKDSTDPVKNCAVCHLDPKEETVPCMRDASTTKNPFHIRCIGCHKGEKKGPTSCPACHKP